MRNAILLILLLALGAGALVVVGLEFGEGGDAGLSGGHVTSGAAERTADGALLPGAGQSGPDSARADAAGPDAVADESRPGGAEPEAMSDNQARLRGRVVDVTGAPIPGARIALESAERGMILGRSARAELASTTSDARGGFAFERSPGEFGLRIEAERFAPRRETVELLAGATFDLGDVQLDTGVLLAGRVIDPDGAPVPGVRVLREGDQPAGMLRLGPAAEERPVAVTDDAGLFRVASQGVGPWRLRFASDAHPDVTLEGVTDTGGEVVDDLVAELEPGATIEGRVADMPADLALRVRAVPAIGTEDRVEFDLAGPTGERAAQILADGRFVVLGLAPDRRYRLTLKGAEDAGFGSASHAAAVFAAAGARDVELRFSVGASLALQVVDATSGVPLERFTVEGGFEWLMPLVGDEGQTRRSFPDGRVLFEGLRPREGRARMRLAIAAAGYELYEREGILLTPEGELDFGLVRLQPMPVVRVHVRDASTGAPIAKAQVEARIVAQRGGRRVRLRSGGAPPDAANVRRGTSDASGLALVSSLPGRSVRLTVRAAGYAPWQLDGLELPPLGDLDQDVLLDAGGRVTVRVLDGDGGPAPRTRLEHHAPFGAHDGGQEPRGPRGRSTDGGGVLVYTMLEPGTHQFRVAPERTGGFMIQLSDGPTGPGWQKLEVEPGGEHQLLLELPLRARVFGQLTEDGEPLPGATLALYDADGDPGQRMLARMMGGGHRGKSDSSGRFDVQGLAPGRWLVEVSHAARAMPFETELRLEQGDNDQDLELPFTAVEARVVDADGKPIVGAAVRAKRQGGPTQTALVMIATVDRSGGETSFRMGGDEGLVPVLTDQEGRVRLRGITPDVSVVLEASADGFETGRSESFEVALGAVREGIVVALAAGGVIVVDVRDGRGDPVPGGYIASLRWEGAAGQGAGPQLAPVQDGRARFENLASGSWAVSLQEMAEGAPGAEPVVEPRTVEVQPGATETVSFTVN